MMLEFTSENIKFLRTGVGLSIQELSEVLSIKPAHLFKYETSGYKFGEIGDQEEKKDFMEICSFFIVFLDDLVYADLTLDSTYDKEVFKILKTSLLSDEPEPILIEKRKLINTVLSKTEEVPECEDDSVAKYLLRLVHYIYRIPDVYHYFRRRAKIEKGALRNFEFG